MRRLLRALRIFRRVRDLETSTHERTKWVDQILEARPTRSVVEAIARGFTQKALGALVPCIRCGVVLHGGHPGVVLWRRRADDPAAGTIEVSCVWCESIVKSRGLHERVTRDQLRAEQDHAKEAAYKAKLAAEFQSPAEKRVYGDAQ